MKTTRRFRADYCIKNKFIVIEVNGGQFTGGRHNRGGKGYENDLTKGNIASLNGWVYLQYTYQMLKRDEHILDFEFLAKIDLLKNPPFG